MNLRKEISLPYSVYFRNFSIYRIHGGIRPRDILFEVSLQQIAPDLRMKNTSYISTVMTFSYSLINIDPKCTLGCLCVLLRGDVMDMLCTPPINLSCVANTEGHCCDRARPDNAQPI